jgi:choline kinase
MRLIVLAAGMGSRLGSLTLDTPKCLITIAQETILGRQLDQAASTGRFSEAVIVTGYRAEQVAAFSEQWSATGKLPVRLVPNPRFMETNNSYSLFIARHLLDEGFVLIDGDLVLDSRIVERVAACNRSSLVVDTNRTLDPEAMKCRLDEQGLISALSKEIPIHQAAAESIGLSFIDSSDAAELIGRLTDLVGRGAVNDYYERAFQDMLEGGWRPVLLDVAGLAWEEVDDLRDLERARSLLEVGPTSGAPVALR